MKRRCEIKLLDKTVSRSGKGFARYNKDEGRVVLARVGGVSRSEFYTASAAGMKPSATFSVHPADYQDEKFLVYEGKRYRVLRTYPKSLREIELVCEGDEPNDA